MDSGVVIRCKIGKIGGGKMVHIVLNNMTIHDDRYVSCIAHSK